MQAATMPGWPARLLQRHHAALDDAVGQSWCKMAQHGDALAGAADAHVAPRMFGAEENGTGRDAWLVEGRRQGRFDLHVVAGMLRERGRDAAWLHQGNGYRGAARLEF